MNLPNDVRTCFSFTNIAKVQKFKDDKTRQGKELIGLIKYFN
jgi:hypothetical protein